MQNTEAQLDRIERHVVEACDRIKIRNLLNSYLFAFHSADIRRILDCFALEDPNTSVEFGRGCLKGKAELTEFYNERVAAGQIHGSFVEHGEGATIVEIAKDRKTARVAAISFGYKMLPPAESEAWDIGRYYFELLRTEEGWKIWHLQWILVAEGDTCYGWLAQNIAYQKEEDYPSMDETVKAEVRLHPSDCFVDYYKPDEINHYLPEPPKAYEAWDGYAVTRDTRGY